MHHAEDWKFNPSRPWTEQAACAGMPVEQFYGNGGTSHSKPRPGLQELWDKAKLICRDCPVLTECRRDSLGEEYGVWGGRDQRERYHDRRALAAQIRTWPQEDRLRLARRLRAMRRRGMPWLEIRRLTGLGPKICDWLLSEYNAWREEQGAQGREVPYEKGRPFSEPQKRRVIALREKQGLSYKQIAAVIGCSHELVRTTLRAHRGDRPTQSAAPADWPTDPPQRGAWVRYANRYADADYVGQTEDGAWFLLRVNSRGGWTGKWFEAKDVRLGPSVRPILKERKSTNGKKVIPEPSRGSAA